MVDMESHVHLLYQARLLVAGLGCFQLSHWTRRSYGNPQHNNFFFGIEHSHFCYLKSKEGFSFFLTMPGIQKVMPTNTNLTPLSVYPVYSLIIVANKDRDEHLFSCSLKFPYLRHLTATVTYIP